MIVLPEVTIDAMHALFDVNVFQVNRQALFGGAFGSLLEFGGVHVIDDVTVGIQEVAFAVGLVDIAENPAVTVEVGELRARQLRVDRVAQAAQEVYGTPVAAQRRLFRIAHQDFLFFAGRQRLLLFGVHAFIAVGLQVPPGRAVEAHHHECAGMHVTDDALA